MPAPFAVRSDQMTLMLIHGQRQGEAAAVTIVGVDTLTGGEGRDTFVFRADSGHDVITDFDVANPDYILLDSQTGYYDGYLGGHLGAFRDGMQIFNSHGDLVCTVHSGDWNNDGQADTQFEMSSGATLTLLGVNTSDLNGYMLFGG